MMFIAALMGKYADAGSRQKHICWARMQMRYITGSLPNTGAAGLLLLLLEGCCEFCVFHLVGCLSQHALLLKVFVKSIIVRRRSRFTWHRTGSKSQTAAAAAAAACWVQARAM
jgi:hypothetical protein